MSERFSLPCRYCQRRFAVAPGGTRESERRLHDARCPLSIDCPYCKANVGHRCTIRATNQPSPTHQSRKWWAA